MTQYTVGLKGGGQHKKPLTRQSGKVDTGNVSLAKLLAKSQKIFNTWVRNRDKDLPCICCGSYNTSDAGHYRSQGHYSSLRFNEVNVNLCCRKCNFLLSGNLIEYRRGLVKRYGEQKVLMLESANKFKKWSRTELFAIIQMYKQ